MRTILFIFIIKASKDVTSNDLDEGFGTYLASFVKNSAGQVVLTLFIMIAVFCCFFLSVCQIKLSRHVEHIIRDLLKKRADSGNQQNVTSRKTRAT